MNVIIIIIIIIIIISISIMIIIIIIIITIILTHREQLARIEINDANSVVSGACDYQIVGGLNTRHTL